MLLLHLTNHAMNYDDLNLINEIWNDKNNHMTKSLYKITLHIKIPLSGTYLFCFFPFSSIQR